MFGEAFEVVPGDVTEVNSLERALASCHGVHISVGGPVDQLSAENVAALAPTRRVERITYLSGSTVAEQNGWFPMIQQKLNAEKAIRTCGTPYTIFCPTWPFESLTLFVRDGRASMIGKLPTPYHWFAAEDLARMVSTAYQLEEAANRRLYIQGPEAITMKEALERYCRAVHPQIGSVSALPTWLAKLLGLVTRNDQLVFAAELMAYFDKAGELGDPTEANQLLGGPTITLDVWIKHRLD
jgi:NADH dehydrogenase